MKTALRSLFLFCLPALLSYSSFAQLYSVTGQIADGGDGSSMVGVSVLLLSLKDTSIKNGTVTDVNGHFQVDNVAAGQYMLKAAYLGYDNLTNKVTITGPQDLGVLKMKTGSNTLKNVIIEGKQIRAQQMGDTSQFNADAYKTHPDATAEDLVTKMPGVTSDNTGVKVNGESVQQVYVDGKPFFGTDPTLALKNLPSEVIDKIQVFDKLSDQAQFTGFDDGTAQKTINIVTKKNKSEGQFGKIYGGYGTDDRYLTGGNLNIFDGNRRISILELSNNVNQQNFSSQDILGVTGGGQNRGGFGGGGSRGSFGGGGGGASNFLVGPQGGNTTTHSAGINYSDNWGSKIKVSGSYFFNYTDNTTSTYLTRNYFGDTISNAYSENDISASKNINHRFNFRFEYTIDSFNSLIITPSLSYQLNTTNTGQTDTFSNNKNEVLNSYALNNSTANNTGYNFSNNILLQHKFKKPKRTISVNFNTSMNEKDGTGTFYSKSRDFIRDTSSGLDQNYTLYNNGYTLSTSVNYTEPVGKKGQIQANYSPSYTKNLADKESYNLDPATSTYVDRDTLLSNKYDNTYTTQKGGLSYRYGDKKLSFTAGANIQFATLDGNQYFPAPLPLSRTFENVLPSAMLNYRFADGRNLRIMYRTNTTAPSLSQLQNAIDVSNPLLLKTGNQYLNQDYEQTLIVRYGLTKAKNAHNFFVFLYANYINSYIGNETIMPVTNPIFFNGTTIQPGRQLTLPVNLNGYFNERTFFTYGLPVDVIKSNLNLNGGINYTRTPGLINNGINSSVNYSNNTAPSAGFVLGSNISQNVDFTLSYSGSYNIVNNTTQTQANNDYYNHTASFKINWILFKGIVLNTNITHTYYSTFTNSASVENYLLWNAYIGYKFLKNKALEARFSAFDLLNQNKSVSRTVADTYIENSVTQVLKQYFMFNLTYTLRNFKGPMPTLDSDNNQQERPHGRMGGSPKRWVWQLNIHFRIGFGLIIAAGCRRLPLIDLIA